MPGQQIFKPYDKVSLIYNGLMKNVDFRFWAGYIQDLAERYISSNASVIELAAGTCNIAARLKNKFNNIIVTDISFPMLKTADENGLKKICCSMIQLPVKCKFDFIFSTFDSINYLLTEKDLLILFREANSILKENGIFTFDASLENNSLEFKDMQISEGWYKDHYYKRISTYNKRNRIHKNVFHIRHSSGIRYKEIHRQKIYSFDTYFRIIDEAGLNVKECYDSFSFNEGTPESERVQFVVGKKSA